MDALLTTDTSLTSEEIKSRPLDLRVVWTHLTLFPIGVVWRYVIALLFGFLALAIHLNTVLSPEVSPNFFWGNILGMGLVFGHLYAFTVIFASEYPSRLRMIWPTWARAIMSGIFGVIFGTLMWAAWTFLFLHLQEVQWHVLILGGGGIAAGFVIATLFRLPAIVNIVIVAVTAYLPIYFAAPRLGPNANETTTPLLAYWENDQLFTVAIPFVILLAVGAFLPQLWRELRRRE